MKKITNEIFFYRAKLLHGDRFDYSKSDFKSLEHRIIIICKKHGEFSQLPRKHLEGQGCKRCSARENQIKSVKPWEQKEDEYLKNNFNKPIYILQKEMKRGKKFILNRIKELSINRESCRKIKKYEDIKLSKFESYKRGAEIRGFCFEIDIEDIWEKFLEQRGKCALTGWNISFKNETASLDRIDSSIGYTLKNIQIVHKDINILKMDWSESFLFDASKAIFLNCKEKHKRKEIKWAVDNWHDTEHPFYAEVSDDENYQPIVRKYDDLF